ncbi:5'/3'-nucleotidase SurE [Microbacterium sp. LWH7-1.2]|uniref:5'/3'-nucleotidase SurE n=1 Tax=Microbacterium sp. LWH7-1.2 TaxID=3135257 RepID=UPI003139EA18
MTRTLITNDDGIDAPGLHVLAKLARDAGLDVTVAAPMRQSSGSSASIVAAEVDGRIAIEQRELPGLDGVLAYAVRGGPAVRSSTSTHPTRRRTAASWRHRSRRSASCRRRSPSVTRATSGWPSKTCRTH